MSQTQLVFEPYLYLTHVRPRPVGKICRTKPKSGEDNTRVQLFEQYFNNIEQ